jgi:hypothetical protein
MPIVNGTIIKGFALDKNGKLVRNPRKLDVSARIRQRKSKKQRVVSQAKAAATRGYRP